MHWMQVVTLTRCSAIYLFSLRYSLLAKGGFAFRKRESIPHLSDYQVVQKNQNMSVPISQFCCLEEKLHIKC